MPLRGVPPVSIGLHLCHFDEFSRSCDRDRVGRYRLWDMAGATSGAAALFLSPCRRLAESRAMPVGGLLRIG